MCALDISINLFDYFRVLEANSIKELVVTSILYNCQIIGGRDFMLEDIFMLTVIQCNVPTVLFFFFETVAIMYQQYLITASRHKQKVEYELTPQSRRFMPWIFHKQLFMSKESGKLSSLRLCQIFI